MYTSAVSYPPPARSIAATCAVCSVLLDPIRFFIHFKRDPLVVYMEPDPRRNVTFLDHIDEPVSKPGPCPTTTVRRSRKDFTVVESVLYPWTIVASHGLIEVSCQKPGRTKDRIPEEVPRRNGRTCAR